MFCLRLVRSEQTRAFSPELRVTLTTDSIALRSSFQERARARARVPFARATPKKRSGTHFAMNNDVAELSLAVIMPGLAAFVDQPSIHLVIRLVDDH